MKMTGSPDLMKRVSAALNRLFKWVAKGVRNHPVCGT
jgi:hypothetical protein